MRSNIKRESILRSENTFEKERAHAIRSESRPVNPPRKTPGGSPCVFGRGRGASRSGAECVGGGRAGVEVSILEEHILDLENIFYVLA